MEQTLDTLLDKARELYEQDKNLEAAQLAKEILHSAIERNDFAAQAHALNTLGTTCFNQNLYEEALAYYLKAEKLMETHVGKKQTVPSLINIAIIYNRQQLFEQAIETYERALKWLEGENISMLHAQLHNGLGNVFSEWGKPQQAFQHFRQVVSISASLAIPYGEALGLSNLACVAIKMNDAAQAEDYAQQTLAIAAQNEFGTLSLVAETVLADALLLKGNYDDCIEKYLELIPRIEAAHRDDMLQDAYAHLQQAFVSKQDFKAAYETGLKLAEVSARILSVERTKVINAMQVRFETEKKEAALRELQIQSEQLQRKKAEAELESLRSRMNPHFIFNSIGSILHLIQKQHYEKASYTLMNFSTLMREILKQSDTDLIDINKEIVFLESYIQLEGLQFENDFTYEINVDERVRMFEIPTLLLQPVVENAFKHGLFHKQGEKKLTLNFKYSNNNCFSVEVVDNGVGFEKAESINRKKAKHKSFATHAAQKRIALLQETLPIKIAYHIHHLKDERSEPLGVKAVFEFEFLD